MKPNHAGNEKGYEIYRGDGKPAAVRRGDIFYADLSPVVGSEQGGLRPVLIIQNDVGNRYSPTVIAAAITSRLGKAKLPTHIDVARAADGSVGLQKDSVILLEQIRTLDKRRLRERMGRLDDATMRQVNAAISVSFGLTAEALGAQSAGGRVERVGHLPPSSGAPDAVAVAGTGTGALSVSTAGSENQPLPGSAAAVTPAGLEQDSFGRTSSNP